MEAVPPPVAAVRQALGGLCDWPGADKAAETAARRAAALAVPRAVTRLVGPQAALGRLLSPELTGTREVWAAVVTLGPALEEEVRRLFAEGKAGEGLCLDGAGNAVLAETVREVGRRLNGVWLAPGCHAVPLSLVPEVAAAAGSGEIGVEVLPSGMLRPEKSVAGWVMPGATQHPPACEGCTSPICPWRGRR